MEKSMERTISIPVWMGLNWDGVSTTIPKFKKGTVDYVCAENLKKMVLESMEESLINSGNG